MSLLPQRKKSPEEIAKLREFLSITSPPADALPPPSPEILTAVRAPAPLAEAIAKTVEITSADSMTPLLRKEAQAPKPVRSLKRSERVPSLSNHDHLANGSAPQPESISSHLPAAPAIIRSVRKSEQTPLPETHAPLADSKLPTQRRSEHEIQKIRRQEMLAMQSAGSHLQSLVAHPLVIIPGYLLAISGAICIYYNDVRIQFTAACVIAAMLIATFIVIKKPLSQHHAAFIAVISLFVIVFGALHYFPQLRYGT